MKRKSGINKNKFRLTLLLGINIFFLITLVLAAASITGRLLITARVFKAEDYLHGRTIFILTLLTSTALTLATTVRIRILYIKPYKNMIAAMQELAKGRFETRIHLPNTVFQAKESLEFADSFNITAEKLGGMELLNHDFINNFSHEFKTPIASIQGFAKLIREEDLPSAEVHEYLDIIIQESQRLTLLAGNVLELSRVESQQNLSHTEPFQIGEQIRQYVLLLQNKWQAKQIALQTDIEDSVFTGDGLMLKEVWLNIIDNAIKFSPAGGTVTIRCTNLPESYQVAVTDQGSGMTEEVSARIFEKFYQGDSSHAVKGNGLGLAIAAKITTLHSGRITIKSTPGYGSTFTVILPK